MKSIFLVVTTDKVIVTILGFLLFATVAHMAWRKIFPLLIRLFYGHDIRYKELVQAEERYVTADEKYTRFCDNHSLCVIYIDHYREYAENLAKDADIKKKIYIKKQREFKQLTGIELK